MMNRNHAACGLLAGLATVDRTPLESPWQQIAYVALWAGLAVIADWDHHGSTPTQMWGNASELATLPFRGLPGGHRWATHDVILAPLILGGLAWALLTIPGRIIELLLHIAMALNIPAWIHPAIPFLVTLVPLALVIGVTLRMTMLRTSTSTMLNLALSFAGAWWFTQHPVPELAQLLPLIVVGGLIVHAFGDLPTEEGLPVPILWLFTRARIAVPLFEVNGPFERCIITPALALAVTWMAWGHLPLEIQADVLAIGQAIITPISPAK